MDKLLLDDLQRRVAYPSVTILVNVTPGARLSDAELADISGLVDDADRRLTGDVPDHVRHTVIGRLFALLRACTPEVGSEALALCASPEYSTSVRLGRRVAERVVVDDTFATRDLVADLNRTAVFRVLTVSGRRARLLRGDRNRLVEQDDEIWPMERGDEVGNAAWVRRVSAAITEVQAEEPLPTVLAGVSTSVRGVLDACPTIAIGIVRGNHDRTGWADLHSAAWPVMVDWLRSDRADALARLDQARSSHRYAGGIDEIWPLALEGRVELVVVEHGFSMAARLGENGEVRPAADVESPDVVDDIVDDTIEAVMRSGGRAVLVDDGTIERAGRIAGVLRY